MYLLYNIMVSALPFCQWTQLLHDTIILGGGGGRVLCDGLLVYRCLKYSPRNFCHAAYRWHYITGTLGKPMTPSAEILTEDILLWFVNYITLYWQDFQVLSVYGTIAIIRVCVCVCIYIYIYIYIYKQGVSKGALQLWKRIEIYTEDIHNVLNCQNVAKHTEFYLG